MEGEFAELLYVVKLHERCENYEKMLSFIKKAIECAPAGQDELLKVRLSMSLAYKNLTTRERNAWRILMAEQQVPENGTEQRARVLAEYIAEVRGNLNRVCDDVTATVDKYFARLATDEESRVFFIKMKADYLRYKSEANPEDGCVQRSFELYNEARALAEGLSATNAVKLGLALNYSVYLYEISKDCKQASAVAKGAFDEAISGLDTLSDAHYRDSTLIMQLLRDNLTMWTNQEELAGDRDHSPEEALNLEEKSIS